jgi:hypothetical protein
MMFYIGFYKRNGEKIPDYPQENRTEKLHGKNDPLRKKA